MQNFKRINTIFGWATFLIALIVYALTLESSVSLWDCGEFTSASDKLQVVHPPGAPLFLMLGRFFAIFATPGTNEVAMAVNMLSAVASAATVMLTFWITVHFAKKIASIDINAKSVSLADGIAILGSGLVGALAVTFMDTFWFSAVEAEVYASSSCFMALAFWGVLRWERVKEEPNADRWIVFIAFTVGLGIGLHLLNLLVIPAIILYYYFNKFEFNRSNVIKAALIGFGSIAVLQWIVIPKTPTVAAFFDRIFVNSFGLPFNSGTLFFILLIIGAIVFGLYWTKNRKMPIANMALLCFAFIMLGFSTYSMVVIRSAAEPAIDMNDPEDAYSLKSYINREQYGDRPLLNGPYWIAKFDRPIRIDEGSMHYRKGKDGYEETDYKKSYVWDDKYNTILPRMGDMTDKAQLYPIWCGMDKIFRSIQNMEQQKKNLKGKVDQDLERQLAKAKLTKPTFGNNMQFMFKYQIGHMYMRYFLWNFVGRQNNTQNRTGDLINGNWLSGIGFIDNMRLGPQDNMPKSLQSKSRNTYFFLPFILGILGLIMQYKRQKLDFWAVMAMFIFTGVLVVIYLNQPPNEPRERDYTNVGSYQTFCIWIGLSVMFIIDAIKKFVKGTTASISATAIALLAAPVLMASQNWDDHDRSDRYLAISYAKNYLNSCDQNAILFTNGDNDTYPLWYAQNVENYRPDVRVINLSLLPTEWYSSALRRKVFESEPLPMSIPEEAIVEGKREFLRFDTKGYDQNQYFGLGDFVDFTMNDKNLRVINNEKTNYLPVRKLGLKVNKQDVIDAKVVPPKDYDKIVDYMKWNLGGRQGLSKGDLVVLDIIRTNAEQGWKRPIHWTTTTGSSVYLNLNKYLRHNGLTFRLVPVERYSYSNGMDDPDMLYKKLIETYEWGKMETNDMFLDEHDKLVPINIRGLVANVSAILAAQGKSDSAIKLIEHYEKVVPESILPINLDVKRSIATVCYQAKAMEKGDKLLTETADELIALIKYYKRFKRNKNYFKSVEQEIGQNVKLLDDVIKDAKKSGREDLVKKYEPILKQYKPTN